LPYFQAHEKFPAENTTNIFPAYPLRHLFLSSLDTPTAFITLPKRASRSSREGIYSE